MVDVLEVMVAHSEEVLAFFTESMRNESLNQGERLSAAKLLAQYRGLLSERLMIEQRYKHDQTLTIVVQSNNPTL